MDNSSKNKKYNIVVLVFDLIFDAANSFQEEIGRRLKQEILFKFFTDFYPDPEHEYKIFPSIMDVLSNRRVTKLYKIKTNVVKL